MANKIWLVAYCPNLLLDYLWPQTIAPTALLENKKIIDCNATAQQQGVHTDMNLATAYCLAPELLVHDNKPQWLEKIQANLALGLLRFASQIDIQTPSFFALEVRSMLKVFESLDSLCLQVEQYFMERHLTVRLATAYSPLAARLLSQYQPGFLIEKSDVNLALGKLQLSRLPFDNKDIQRFERVGIKTLKPLLELPRHEVGVRFGKAVLMLLEQLEGRIVFPIKAFTLPARFTDRHYFSFEATQSGGLLFALKQQLSLLHEFLHQQQKSCDAIYIRLRHRELDDSLVTIRAVRPEHEGSAWLALAQIFFDGYQLKAPVIVMTLSVKGLLARNQENQSLIEQQQTKQEHLVNALSIKLGAKNVYKPALSGRLLPEKSFTKDFNLTKYNLDPPKNTLKEDSNHDSLMAIKPLNQTRPLWIFDDSYPVDVEQYELIFGPERMSAPWWQHSEQRDYYHGRLKNRAGLFWLYRRHDGLWFAQGAFA